MKKIIYVFAFLLSYTAFSQNYKFGKVSVEELEEKFNPQDSSASATYLYKDRRTYFVYINNKFELESEIHVRIKIYNQEGFDYATKKINLYIGGREKETVNSLKGYTFNLIDGKIQKSKLKNDGIFKSELNKYYNQTKFTMPNLKMGSVIEYMYIIQSPYYQNVDEYEFQHDIPIKKLNAKFETPEYFNFKSSSKGYLALKKNINTKKQQITVKSRSTPLQGGKIESYKDNIDYMVNTESYNLSNIPALKNEPFVNNINNYRSSIKYELSYTKFPNSTIDYYSTTWDNVVKTIYKSSNFGNELEKSNYFKEDIDAITSGISNPIEKANLIFNYLKSKVKWNGYHGIYTNDGVKKAYKEQTGNVAEINLMLTAMLRYAGLSANPVLVSTRKNGVPLFPTREGYNYVISAIELPDNVILLDATSKYSSPNVLPYRTLNWEGRIIREQGSSALVNLYPNKKANSTIFMNVNIGEDGEINGLIRNALTKHKALNFRESYISRDKDEYIQNLENKHDGIEISDFEVKNELDLSKPITTTYKFSAEDQYELIGDKIYINPLFFFTTEENPFKLEAREFPIDFGYPSTSKYNVNIEIPAGYAVESLPEPVSIKLSEELGSFQYNISSNNNKIQLVIKYSINTSIIPAHYYIELKEYFKQIVSKENETIVLTKQ